MKLSANQASKEAGIAKKTLLEAIKSKRMSAEKNDKGHWEIDTSELFRVFPKTGGAPVAETDTHPPIKPYETSALETEVKLLRELLAKSDATVEDLRGRLDKETDKLHNLTTNILTDKRGQGGKRGFLGLFSRA